MREPGSFKAYGVFSSRFVADRRVDVWLPPGYQIGNRRYPVIYVHDGQNVFDETTAYAGVAWDLHHAVSRLTEEDPKFAAIVVAIWNTDARIPEFMPQKPLLLPHNQRILRRFEERYGDEPVSDEYLRFITRELKPRVDREYRTNPSRAATALLGSSMGGLVSLYGICEYPDVFGAAICMSTSWTVGGKPTLGYLRDHIPDPDNHLLYFDHGNEAQIGAYEKLQHAVDVLFASAGYQRDINFMSLRFDGADHSEGSWKNRVEVPLRFALGSARLQDEEGVGSSAATPSRPH